MQRPRRWSTSFLAGLLLVGGLALIPSATSPSAALTNDCARRYVATGDGVPAGEDAGGNGSNSEDTAYPKQLLDEHMLAANEPWCLYNEAEDGTTTDSYQSGGQMGTVWERRPDLVTIHLGRQNSSIVEHITTCFRFVRDHDFIEANACALAVLGNAAAWDELNDDLAEILNTFKVQMAGNPQMVVAVLGYFNPFPKATSVATDIPTFCAKLVFTTPGCTIRWVLLPPALVILDQVVKKLNDTIAPVVQQFTISSQGRFVFVNPYDKMRDHCMSMDVEIKTKVYIPTNQIVDRDTSNDFGCDDEWIASDGTTGIKPPFLYLSPAVGGVLLVATQTTKNMGVNPNEKGHDCIADLIWEAVKIKLGVPEAPKDVCEG